MLLSVKNITKSFGLAPILKDVSFVLNLGQRAGLVGANGSGKSTLLKIIVGQTEPDSGEVAIKSGIEVGYLPQALRDVPGQTITALLRDTLDELSQLETRMRELEQQMGEGSNLDAVLEQYGSVSERFEQLGGYEIDHRIDEVFAGLRIEYIARDREISTLSGGEKSRVALAAMLIGSPDLLLLDEPTNHLDFLSMQWLESYLRLYKGAFLAVSHDRAFLNHTAEVIFEIDEHSRELRRYAGNYDAYLTAKQREREQWVIDYEAQRDEIRELKQAIKVSARQVSHNRAPTDNDKFAPHFFGGRVEGTISRNVRSAEEKLRRIEAAPIPRPPKPLRINPDFDPETLRGHHPLTVSNIRKSFGTEIVLNSVSFTLSADSRIALVGENGAGKSTLLDIIVGLTKPDSGEVIITPSARIGYLRQDDDVSAEIGSQTLLEAYAAELTPMPQEEQIAELLRYGLFRYEQVHQRVADLSIGQRRKLQIAQLIAARANLLLLDEPTNHISFDVIEELESALREFPGAVLAVSHDRRFIANFTPDVWELRNGQLIKYVGGFAEYTAALEALV